MAAPTGLQTPTPEPNGASAERNGSADRGERLVEYGALVEL